MVYDVYIKEHGKNYYQKFHQRGSKEGFEFIEASLAIYAKMHIIDDYYIYVLPQEDKEGEEDA